MSDATLLQQLNQALGQHQLSHAVTLGFTLAGQGELPILELFRVAAELATAGQGEQAIALYRLWLRHAESPLSYAVRHNLAVALLQAGQLDSAEREYRKAISLQPEFVEAHLHLGTLYERRQQPKRALAAWRRALELIHPAQPNSQTLHLQTLNHLARMLEQQRRPGEALEMLTRSLLLDPQQPQILAHWIRLRQQLCAWPVYQPLPELDQAAMEQATSALAALGLSDDPDLQMAAARRHLADQSPDPAGETPLSDQRGYDHARLRIGYLAVVGAPHAPSIPLAELSELHDRKLVEVYCFYWSETEDCGPSAPANMDHQIQIGQMNDHQAALSIRSHEIDILVDLRGLAPGGRPGILAWRPAPVQIAWPGFPGSTGLPALDYVLADEYVLPPALAPFFSERPLYLPACYQINERQRRVGRRVSRAACGLPRDAFVFCCFNANRKFTPEVFASWMCILQRVPGSVLWLMTEQEQARINLLGAAAAYGVPASRLYFAERLPRADHLARLQLADLYLDTLPFNAGVGASDALWAGLPLLTRSGHGYAARMAGSQLRAAGLPELVTHGRTEYEEMAVQLARQPERLAALRQRLRDNRDSCALFDTPRLVRNLEQAYRDVARGVRSRPSSRRPRAGADAETAMPLVSLLLPVHGSRGLETVLRVALAQSYANCEIVIADSGPEAPLPAGVARLLGRRPQIRHVRCGALPRMEQLAACLQIARGDYVNFVLEGELPHPDKIARMMHYYRHYPSVGLVTSFQRLEAQPEQTPLFAADTVVKGDSLGAAMLTGQIRLAGELGAMLLPRAALGAAPGCYGGRHYTELSGVATALALLAGRDCVYLHEALTTCGAPKPQSSAGAPVGGSDTGTVRTALEWLHLLFEAGRRGQYVTRPEDFQRLLAARLNALGALLAAHHAPLRVAFGEEGADGAGLEEIHLALRAGYQLLLGPGME